MKISWFSLQILNRLNAYGIQNINDKRDIKIILNCPDFWSSYILPVLEYIKTIKECVIKGLCKSDLYSTLIANIINWRIKLKNSTTRK